MEAAELTRAPGQGGGLDRQRAMQLWRIRGDRRGGPARPRRGRAARPGGRAGYAGIDLGPVGYLGSVEELPARLADRRLALAGGFMALPFGDRDRLAEEIGQLDLLLDTFDAAGSSTCRPEADAGRDEHARGPASHRPHERASGRSQSGGATRTASRRRPSAVGTGVMSRRSTTTSAPRSRLPSRSSNCFRSPTSGCAWTQVTWRWRAEILSRRCAAGVHASITCT